MKLYIVNAYRNGNREKHSYTVGVFSKKFQAIKLAESHTTYRGGKYVCIVETCILDKCDNDMDNYTNELYKTKTGYEDYLN